MMARHQNVELAIQYFQHVLRSSGQSALAYSLEGIEIRNDRDAVNALAILEAMQLKGDAAVMRNRLVKHAKSQTQLSRAA